MLHTSPDAPEVKPRADAPPADATVVSSLRRALLAILLLGMTGILTELFLMEHTDGFWQRVPLVLLGAGILLTAVHALGNDNPVIIRSLQGLMLIFVASGLAGVFLHYSGNVEFEREMNPAVAGLSLVKEALMGATPALAPGTMIQLGLLGLAATFRHPSFRRKSTGAGTGQVH